MPQWNDVFRGIPYILKKPIDGPHEKVVSSSGCRPYISIKTPVRWRFKPYAPIPAEVKINAAEKLFALPYTGMILIEPHIKASGHSNKAWPAIRWRELARDPRFNFVQCGPAGTEPLVGAMLVQTPTFRHAMAVLSVCRAFVGTEGGLMHAAAALGVPSVILWSEFISPRITGYPTMRNLRTVRTDYWCGMRSNCRGCRQSMEAISIDSVKASLMSVLSAGGQHEEDRTLVVPGP
jgi:ADP-heptose:LPS heptosyltransferase